MKATLASRDLVLVGAGHTNLHVVRMWRMQPMPDVQLTLVSPFGSATYSGMLPGTLAGLYEPHEMEIDLHRFTSGTGIRLLIEEVTGLDPLKREVSFADRPPIRFDVASIGIGSVPSIPEQFAQHPQVLSIKPMATFRLRFQSQIERAVHRIGKQRPVQIGVVGAGAAGVEVSLCLEASIRRLGIDAEFVLIDSGKNILRGYLTRTIYLARTELERRRIQVRLDERVTNFENDQLLLSGGESLGADIVIWATSAAPPDVLEQFQLPKSDDGFLSVRPTLQTTGDHPVFAVGDTATLVENRIPKAGVYAVREGPILWENIRRTLSGAGELVPYKPQHGFLSLLATGDGRAIGQYKSLSIHNRLAWNWKDYLDRKFMRKHQDYEPMSDRGMSSPDASARQKPATDASSSSPPAMRCNGCGSKVGTEVLSAALGRLDVRDHGDVLVGLGSPDDVAILNADAGLPDLLSIDFFPAFLDDPYLVGRVAALNAMSDVWATGGRVLGALAIVTLPEGRPSAQEELLYQLLAGGVRELGDVEATLLGGHTTQGPELMIGFSIVGTTDGKPPLTKAGLKPGDHLVLTKSLGTGILLAGHMQCLTHAAWMGAMIESMLVSNVGAANTAREFAATALTDVTGFGLAGHLMEMLDASRVDAKLDLSSLPLLPGVAELVSLGVRSSLDPGNRHVSPRVMAPSDSHEARGVFDVVFDPQTSGGLLIGVPAEEMSGLVAELRDSDLDEARVIGEVLPMAGDEPTVDARG